MIIVTKIRNLDLSEASTAGRPLHLSAASGLVCVDSFIYVVSDDELHLGVFSSADSEPGYLIRLLMARCQIPNQPERSISLTLKRCRYFLLSGSIIVVHSWRSVPALSPIGAWALCSGCARRGAHPAERCRSFAHSCSARR